ncbi:SURF1 family protein [Pollutimonas harenae]|uniref:SURF1-like protein n=1 Tax=Pollutimonas harenae TaxID=657015 RepID=A0A853GRG1_9BURK|nr:SURF1 family protein [Pollutimonas harenae]NYT84747.1 SURF1 family protein [Pollutimonas harenae]TEA72852.1 SURF1 family protein [Pollutimonas harenae]
MARLHTIYRTLFALLLLGIVAIVCASLGNWQLDRAAQRIAIKHAIDSGRNSPPLHIEPNTPPQALTPWRPASAHGVWRHEFTVLLENRNYQGRPGYWVATPLMLDPATAVLVLRGWLPRPASIEQPLPPIPTPNAEQTITGELLSRVPRLFELSGATQLPAHLPDPANTLPRVQNLGLDAYAAATGLKFIPAVLAQTADAAQAQDTASTPLLREWPEPSLDADKNKGYALQWFSFAAIAAIAWLVIAWRALRRRH